MQDGKDKKAVPQQTRIEELKRLVGKLSLELEVAKKSFEALAEIKATKRELSRQMSERYPNAGVSSIRGDMERLYIGLAKCRTKHWTPP